MRPSITKETLTYRVILSMLGPSGERIEEGASMGVARVLTNRYVVAGLAGLVVFLSVVAVALGYMHIANGVYHGLQDAIQGSTSVPYAQTNPPGGQWSSAAVRHYFDNGS